jgi:hypothetical protein
MANEHRTHVLAFRVTDDEAARLLAQAAREGRSVSSWVRRMMLAVSEELGRPEEPAPPTFRGVPVPYKKSLSGAKAAL